MTWIYFAVTLIAGMLIGIVLAAVLTAGKIAGYQELYEEERRLNDQLLEIVREDDGK